MLPIDLRVSIQSNQSVYIAGDEVIVWGSIENYGRRLEFIEVAVLDYMGYYAFWPSWTDILQGKKREMNTGDRIDEVFLYFYWPAGAGAYDNIRVWHAAANRDFTEVLGDISFCQFSAR